jgi:hypothetical protein
MLDISHKGHKEHKEESKAALRMFHSAPIRCVFFVLFVVIFLLLPADAAESTGWKAGVAKIAITPEHSMWMSGYAARTKPAEGKLHDLWAKALVLEDPAGHRAVLVTMDLVGIDRRLSVAVCEELRKKYRSVRRVAAKARLGD